MFEPLVPKGINAEFIKAQQAFRQAFMLWVQGERTLNIHKAESIVSTVNSVFRVVLLFLVQQYTSNNHF